MEKIRESKQRSERGNSVDQRDLWRNRREENGGKEEGRSEELKKKEERKKRRKKSGLLFFSFFLSCGIKLLTAFDGGVKRGAMRKI